MLATASPRTSPTTRTRSVRLGAMLGLAFLLGAEGRTQASLTLTSSSATTTYSVRGVDILLGSPNGTPVLTNNILTSIPGYFQTSEEQPNGVQNVQTVSLGSLSTTRTARADPGQIGGEFAPFGAGSTSLTAFSNGTIAAGAVSRAGLNWSSTFVSTGGEIGVASVSVTTATSSFTNFTTTQVSGRVGASVSLTGSLDSTPGVPSFVAASLATTITTRIGNVTSTINLTPIIFAYGAFYGEESISPTFQPVISSVGTYGSPVLSGFKYSFTGVSREEPIVTFGLNDGFTVSSTLTLIADPSLIELGDTLDQTGTMLLPDFGAFVVNPVNLFPDNPTAVPEPGTLAAAAVGTLAAAVVAYRRRRA